MEEQFVMEWKRFGGGGEADRDGFRGVPLKAEEHSAVCAVADAGEGKGAIEFGSDCAGDSRVEAAEECQRGAHRTDRMRTGGADADFKEVEDAGAHLLQRNRFAAAVRSGKELMPVELAPFVDAPIPPRSPIIYPPRKRWTRAECESLESTGLWDRERLELIDGELITKMPKKRPHVVVLMAIIKWFGRGIDQMRLNSEGPIDVAPEDNPTSEPEPDLAVLAKAGPEYMHGNPPASDVQLLIEISDSTLSFDLGPKARLYARAGIPEYWVFDINERRLIVHRGPQAGAYSSVTAYYEGESIAPLAMPEVAFPVAVAYPFPA